MAAHIKRLANGEDAQGVTEDALILGLVVLGMWLFINASGLGSAISQIFTGVKEEVAKIGGG